MFQNYKTTYPYRCLIALTTNLTPIRRKASQPVNEV